MKKLLFALVALVAISCGGKENTTPANPIEGTKWVRPYGNSATEYVELCFKDNTMTVAVTDANGVYKDKIHSGSYSIKGNEITMSVIIPNMDYYFRTGREYKRGVLDGNIMTVYFISFGGTVELSDIYTKK